MEVDRFYKYAVHVLRPQNTESGEPELKNIGEKLQYDNELILHNYLINAGWNQITETIK